MGDEKTTSDINDILGVYSNPKEKRKYNLPNVVEQPNKNNPLDDNFLENEIVGRIDVLVTYFYENSPKELSYEQYKEYLLMVIDYSDRELYERQMERFNYVTRPIKDEEGQLFDSLNILQTYLMDITSDGFIFLLEDKQIIDSTITEIIECLENGDIETGKYKLVSLQMLMGLDVRFYPVLKNIITKNLPLSNFVDYGERDKGKGLIR